MNLGAYLPLVLLVILGYLLLIRPARKRASAAQQLQNALSPGDEVMLTSGIFASILEVSDETARVEIAPGIIVRVHRRAIGQIVRDLQPPDDSDEYDASAPAGEVIGEDNSGVN